MSDGWIKLYRQMLSSTIFTNSDLLKFWIWVLLKASHVDRMERVGLQQIELKAGSFVFGRKRAAAELDMSENKVYRFLKQLEKDGMLDSKSNSKYTVVSVVKWEFYQSDNEKIDSNPNNKSTTNRQQIDTNKNVKNVKNLLKDLVVQPEEQPALTPQQLDQSTDVGQDPDLISQQPDKSADAQRDIDTIKAILDALNQRAGTNYQSRSKDTQKHIRARLREGYTLDDFVKVIDIKVKEWGHEPAIGEKDMRPYLRPATLFGPKFESYLNQKLTPAASKITRIKPNAFHNFEQRSYDYADLERRFIKKANSGDLPLPKQG